MDHEEILRRAADAWRAYEAEAKLSPVGSTKRHALWVEFTEWFQKLTESEKALRG